MSNRSREMITDVEAQTNGVEPQVTIFNKVIKQVTLKFEDVTYKVKRGQGFFKKKMIKTEEKLILKGFSGMVYPGETLAMLGPSGSGKTTLLTALGGRLGRHGLTGTITYNGKPFSKCLNRNTGFVTQQDIMYPHLTVTETLVFTALLRLPNTYSKQDKIMQAEAVISQLGLTRCKNRIVGGPTVRGVSGGEKKRVSIGQEMLINPSLLLLDEPTSGLDSTTAQMIVSKLWELGTKGGRTVVMTIHQPSSRLFYMFHKVLLLSEGSPLYFGLGKEVMQYFAGIGYAPSVTMNPADFLLDLSNGISPDNTQKDKNMVKQYLVSAYKMHIADKVEELSDHHQIDDGVNTSNNIEDKQFGRWPTTWWQQFTTLTRRGVKERKHAALSPIKIAQVVTVECMVGLLWWQSGSSHLQDKMGLLFFYSTFWGVYPVFQAIFTFPKERKMLEKERSSGMYRLSSYFMSRVIGDLPMELILPTSFLIITYWMAGLKPPLLHFLHTLAVLLFSVLVAQGLGLAVGALVMHQEAAATLGSVLMMLFLLAGGYYVQDVPPFIAWIRYLSISHYTYKLLLGSQYKADDTYPCDDGNGGTCLVREFPTMKNVGLNGQVVSAIGLVVMFVGYRLVAYIALMRIGMPKR